MTRARVPGSFRDPSGFLFQSEGVVYRQVNPVFRDHYDLMMQSGFHRAAVDEGLLISHREVEAESFPGSAAPYKILRPEQIAFISYPYEWCFSQLKDAALLTLRIQRRALEFGLSLRDASAYNVQFLRGLPVLIDSLSFEAYCEGRPWVAYQQFCKHFLAPLALMAHTHVDLRKLLRVNIDGIPLDLASRLLPGRTRIKLPLLLHVHLHARAHRKHADRPESAAKARETRVTRTALTGLLDSLEVAVRSLQWEPKGTEWADYYSDTNYSTTALEEKKSLISGFLDEICPKSLWDLGANTGFFSRIASDLRIQTVACDVDDAAVEKNYRDCRGRGEDCLLPLVMDLTNPSPGIGWNNDERMSLFERGPADAVMALALVHHLAIGNNVPLSHIAHMFHRLCRFLIIEFVPKSDSQVQRLLANREDIFPNYDQQGFEEAFSDGFSLLERTALQDSERVLYLFQRD
jgi:hypothetical protein